MEKYTKQLDQYKVIYKQDLSKLLTEEEIDLFQKDKIRYLGPTKDTVYFWNVEDIMKRNCYKTRGVNEM